MVTQKTQLMQKARMIKCPHCKGGGVRPEQKEGQMTGKMVCLNCRKVFQ